MKQLHIYNSTQRTKERFEPLNAPNVGMYVCGPTVYNEVHLGNCRTFISFDIVYRYLKYLGYKVRYVRNITDVGHLTDNENANRIEERARLEQIEPMAIVRKYTDAFHNMMAKLNVLPPDIEPTATGHILEQIEMVQEIINNGYAYEVNGSVYFDTQKLVETHSDLYGKLSGKKQEELLVETRDNLKNQSEKRHPSDFAIWVKAAENHIMRWNSPWSEGFPGWHLECSAMSTKYLGKTFDIHGGGMDLRFPHHENEIAQNIGACNCEPTRYWMHGNMLLLDGRKMSKSEDHYVLPLELFTGTSKVLSKAYSPMTLRFLMLQTHYRSTFNLSDAGLQAAEKGLQRLMNGYQTIQALTQLGEADGQAMPELEASINDLLNLAFEDMNDDFNTPQALSRLFDLTSKINTAVNSDQKLQRVTTETLERLKKETHALMFEIFGLQEENADALGNNPSAEALDHVIQLLLKMRQEARAQKDWARSDEIRDQLAAAGIEVKDGKDGATWTLTK